MKKVISFSLWGKSPKYIYGAIYNCILAKSIYPGWEYWFYCGSTVPDEIKKGISENGGRVIEMGEPGDWRGMLWRFHAVDDPQVDTMISRDCDSRLSQREKDAVDAWIASGKSLHVMKDHQWHFDPRVPILGGMFGLRGWAIPSVVSLINEWSAEDKYQTDQEFLSEKIWPLLKDNCMMHTQDLWPTPRRGREFVGQPFDENNQALIQL